MRKLLSVILACILIFTFAACQKVSVTTPEQTTAPAAGGDTTEEETGTQPETDGSEIKTDYGTAEIDEDFKGGEVRAYVTFNGEKFISYNESSPWTAPNGVTYKKGDLLPTWAYLQERLGITIVDATPKSGAKENELLEQASATKFEDANVFMGSPRNISDYGVQGYFIPLNEHYDSLPNFKAFIDSNPAVKATLTQADGNIYLTPYFDDFNKNERMFIMRLDWVKKLLDEEGTYDTDVEIETVYDAFYDYDGGKKVEVGKDIETFNISKNIVTIQNELDTKNGATLVQALKDYIDANYMNAQTGYQNRSDFYISSEAAYDADELVALMRAVKANPVYLTGESKDLSIFSPRRATDWLGMKSFMSIWGVQGVDSRNSFYFINEDNKLVDARIDDEYLNGLVMFNELYQEGLILQDYDQKKGEVSDFRKLNFQTNDGFMTYDYAASTVALHNGIPEEFGTVFEPVVSPAAPWFSDEFTHFAESNRSVKTAGGWGIASHTEGIELESALRLLDYPFSEEGLEVMTFGPEGVYWNERFEFGGKQIPKLLDSFATDAAELAGGNWSNFMRGFIGATLGVGHIKQTIALETQVSNEHYANGINRILGSNTMLAQLSSSADPKTRIVPTILPLDEDQIEAIQNATHGTYYNEWQTRIIKYGFGAAIPNSTDVVPTLEEFKANLIEKGIELETKIMNAAYDTLK